MNRSFWELNKYKLASTFLRNALFLVALVQIFFLFLGTSVLSYPRLRWNLFLGLGILFPLLIFWVNYWTWHRERSIRNRVFARPPLKSLEQIGFDNCLINENSKWNFTEEVKGGSLGGIKIYSMVKRSNPEEIFFSTNVHLQGSDPKSIPEISKKLEAAGIVFNQAYCIRKYDRIPLEKMTIEELKAELLDFTETLGGIGFKPVEKK